MIGKNIYEVRKKRGITLSELAERAGVSKSYLSNIERSINQNPSIQVVEKIAFVLDVDLKTLLGTGTDQEKIEGIEGEWLDLAYELKEAGVAREQLHEYRILLEFIKWQQNNRIQK